MVFKSKGKVTVSALSFPRVPVGSVAAVPSAPHSSWRRKGSCRDGPPLKQLRGEAQGFRRAGVRGASV